MSRLFGLVKILETRRAKILAAGCFAVALAGCQDEGGLGNSRAYQPIPEETLSLMDQMGSTKYSPVLIRTFKKEAELEVWKMKADGTYGLLKTYPMCRWSGQLGPKRREGDRQVPEGFYYVTPKRMNPNSAYYLSFNVGYPNAYDRAHGRTGSHIMVHGACSSRGCFSMTDKQISEIYAVVREAFSGGQKKVQLQSLPFRMSPKNLAKHRLDKNYKFWKKLKEGSDTFEVAKREPSILVCNRQYVFNSTPADPASRINPRGYCPPMKQDETLVAAIKRKQNQDDAKVAALISKGVNPVKIVYADGGQHKAFAHVSVVSRPGALARGPVEIALDNRGKPLKAKPKKPAATKIAKADSKDGKASAKAATSKSNKSKVAKAGSAKPAAGASNVSAFAPSPKTADPAVATKQPLLKRWFGGLVGGGTSEPAKVSKESAPVANGHSAPVPPPRKAVSTPKRQVKPEKRASALPGIITGSYKPLPSALTAYAPVR